METQVGGEVEQVEVEHTPGKPTSADLAGLCFHGISCFCCEQYPLNRSLHLTDSEPDVILIPNSRNLAAFPFVVQRVVWL